MCRENILALCVDLLLLHLVELTQKIISNSEILDEKITVNEPIEPDKEISEIRAEPYSLPDGFQWDTLNLDEPLVLKELYTLLNENYVEDDDCMFRFDYQPNFIKWYVNWVWIGIGKVNFRILGLCNRRDGDGSGIAVWES